MFQRKFYIGALFHDPMYFELFSVVSMIHKCLFELKVIINLVLQYNFLAKARNVFIIDLKGITSNLLVALQNYYINAIQILTIVL